MLNELEKSVDRSDGSIGKPSFQEGDNAAPMRFAFTSRNEKSRTLVRREIGEE